MKYWEIMADKLSKARWTARTSDLFPRARERRSADKVCAGKLLRRDLLVALDNPVAFHARALGISMSG
jgi:hypothetical protein